MTSKQLFQRMRVLEDIERHINARCGMISMLDFEDKDKRNQIDWTMQLLTIEMHPSIVDILVKHVETPVLRSAPDKWDAIIESVPVTRNLLSFLRNKALSENFIAFSRYIEHPMHKNRFSHILDMVKAEQIALSEICVAYVNFLQSVANFPDDANYTDNLKAMMKTKRHRAFERPGIAAELAKLDELMDTFTMSEKDYDKEAREEANKLLYDNSALAERLWDIRDAAIAVIVDELSETWKEFLDSPFYMDTLLDHIPQPRTRRRKRDLIRRKS